MRSSPFSPAAAGTAALRFGCSLSRAMPLRLIPPSRLLAFAVFYRRERRKRRFSMNLVAWASRRRVGRASRPAIELAARRRLHSQPGTAALPLRRFRSSMREIQSRGILADGHCFVSFVCFRWLQIEFAGLAQRASQLWRLGVKISPSGRQTARTFFSFPVRAAHYFSAVFAPQSSTSGQPCGSRTAPAGSARGRE